MADLAQMRCWPEGATEEYIAARQQLLQAERPCSTRSGRSPRCAAPYRPARPKYSFAEGPPDLTRDGPVVTTTLAELVGDRGLVVYHMMYAPEWEEGCPSCSMWIDGLHGVRTPLSLTLMSASSAPTFRALG